MKMRYVKILAGFTALLPHICFSQTPSKQDSLITIAANPSLKGNGLKRIFIGKNYRKEWTQPVTVPIIDLQTTGLIPEKEGGGKETKSLHMKDSAGRTWALRSIRKYPEKLVPEDLKNTLVGKIVEDDISASYPYGALSMPVFSRAAHVPYLNHWLVYLPDDKALGKFRDKYKETLMLMEEKEPLEFLGYPEINPESISTTEVVEKLQRKNKNRVDQLSVLRARLLDNFVMDFDRHEGQWNWLKKDSAGSEIYFPVPKDRDQVFFTNQGLLPKLAASQSVFPELHGFSSKVKHIDTYNRGAQNFDRIFLNELPEQDWAHETDLLLNAMTDAVIDSALVMQPKEIQQYSTEKIAGILKKKKQFFKDDMMRYYKALSNIVSITGSNEDEDFAVKINEDGTVRVIVTGRNSLATGRVLYDRLFYPSVTKEIRLYGLEGNDHFTIDGEISSIRLRMIGGPGNDQFTNESKSKNLFAYDVNFEKNKVQGSIHNRINKDPLNNAYNRLDFKYKVSGIGPSVEISPKEGFFIGANFKTIRQGFHKEPYASKQVITVTHSLSSSSFHFAYNADFIHAISNTDLLVRSNMMMPTNRRNFFGWGNNTPFDKAKHKQDYYHMKYDIANLDFLGRTTLGNRIRIEYGPSFQYLQLRQKENAGKFISSWSPDHASDNIFQKKLYGGAEFRFVADTRNNEMLTTEGITLNTYVRTLRGLNPHSYNFTQTGGSLALYTDLSTKGVIVLANLLGTDHNIGVFEPAQSQFLGFTEHLRGYVSQRFAGRSAAYNQTEARLKFGKINMLLIRADFGVYGFHDVGRVWADGKQSDVWHDGYGGGIWLAAMKKFVVTGYLSYSNEVKALPWVTLGFVF
jgi:hypothetical protein